MQHHGRNFVTAAFGRHRSMRDRGERGTVPNKLRWRVARVGARQRGSLPRSRVWKGSVPLHNRPYLLAKPLPGRRHPVKAASREAGARDATAFTGWRRSGPMATSRSRRGAHSQPQPPFPAETPFDATSIAHDAGDMLADALVEHGLPRHQLI